MNQFFMIGKVKNLPELKETTNGLKIASVYVDVDRNFMNSEGIYEKDTFKVEIWRGLAEEVCAVCQIGSLLGIKGRFQSKSYTNNDNQTYFNVDIIAEKISILQV